MRRMRCNSVALFLGGMQKSFLLSFPWPVGRAEPRRVEARRGEARRARPGQAVLLSVARGQSPAGFAGRMFKGAYGVIRKDDTVPH